MKLTVDGTELHFEIHGDAHDDGRPWVVLSHSLACAWQMWTPQIAALTARYRVLALDTRGHGQSAASPAPYTFDRLADDVAAIVQSLRIERPHFVGLSLGGMIGQTYALRFPGALASLILADTASRWPASAHATFVQRAQTALTEGMEPLVQPTLGRWFTPAFQQSHPDEVARVGAMIRATPPMGFAGCAAAVPTINTTDRLQEVTCPVLIIVGKDDGGTPPAMAREIHDHVPGSRLVILENASHLSNIEQAAAFNAALLPFLAAASERR
ncbi:MAG TPA: alpha/beta fold hydrolase [Polyangia bacterium]|jgi:3-oxoadipate enol-lactonase